MLSKVHEFYVVTHFKQTLIFEWYMGRVLPKNRNQKDTCYNEIRLYAQKLAQSHCFGLTMEGPMCSLTESLPITFATIILKVELTFCGLAIANWMIEFLV